MARRHVRTALEIVAFVIVWAMVILAAAVFWFALYIAFL